MATPIIEQNMTLGWLEQIIDEPNRIEQAIAAIEARDESLDKDMLDVDLGSPDAKSIKTDLLERITDLGRILDHINAGHNMASIIDRIERLIRSITRLTDDNDHKTKRIADLNRIKGILMGQEDL